MNDERGKILMTELQKAPIDSFPQGIYNAMDQRGKEMCLELLEYMANYRVECRKGYKSLGETEIIPLFNYKGEWITAQQLFENFL